MASNRKFAKRIKFKMGYGPSDHQERRYDLRKARSKKRKKKSKGIFGLGIGGL